MGRVARIALAAIAAWALAGAAAASAAPVSVGMSGWTWGDPVPQGETLNSVAFQGARGYAAGEGGTVLRSDDGGASWIGLSSGSSSNLTLLQEVDPNTVVVGGGCTVRESTDGGTTFHRLPVNESEQGCATKVAAVSFLDASTGYVEQADGSIFLTKDAGQTLEPKTSVPAGRSHRRADRVRLADRRLRARQPGRRQDLPHNRRRRLLDPGRRQRPAALRHHAS